MFVYIGILFIFITLTFLVKVNRSYKYVSGIILTALLIFISGFRLDVGMDYPEYENLFNMIKLGQNVDNEIGFVAICKMCASIGGNAQLMFLTFAIVTLCYVYKAYKMFSPNLIMSLTCFLCMGQLYLTSLNTIRQCVAIALFLYSIKYIINRDAVRYFITIIIAFLFHKTSIVLLPLYFILNRKFSRLVKFISIILLTGSTSLIIQIIQNSPYAAYLRIASFTNESSVINYIYLLLGIGIILYEPKIMVRYPKDRQIFLNINLICTSLFVLYVVFSGTPIVMAITRLTYYFIWFYAIILVRIICDMRRRCRPMIECCFYIILFLLYLRTSIMLGEAYHILPYKINLDLF